jgi:ribonuclease P protein component
MLKAQYHLRRKQDFQKIYRRGDYFFSPHLIIRYLLNSNNYSRFAFVVSSKVAPKAVDRNLIKRRLSEVIRLNLEHLVSGRDIIIIAKKPLLAQKFLSQKENLILLLKRAKIWQE